MYSYYCGLWARSCCICTTETTFHSTHKVTRRLRHPFVHLMYIVQVSGGSIVGISSVFKQPAWVVSASLCESGVGPQCSARLSGSVGCLEEKIESIGLLWWQYFTLVQERFKVSPLFIRYHLNNQLIQLGFSKMIILIKIQYRPVLPISPASAALTAGWIPQWTLPWVQSQSSIISDQY